MRELVAFEGKAGLMNNFIFNVKKIITCLYIKD